MQKTKSTLDRFSSDDIQNIFEEVFEQKVSSVYGMSTFDIECMRDYLTSDTIVNVTIYGSAGAPTVFDFKANKIDEAKEIIVERSDLGSLKFVLVPEKTSVVNSNDYLIVYKYQK